MDRPVARRDEPRHRHDHHRRQRQLQLRRGRAGSYTIREVSQSDYAATTPTTIAVATTSGLVSTANDFGQYGLMTISGEVYNDLGGTGALQNGDPGLSGWTVQLLDVSNAVIATTTTDAGGNYTFDVPAAGTYTVREVLQSGYIQTAPASPGSYTETLAGGQSVSDVDFGDFRTVAYSGIVYNDLNGDGSPEGTEPGLAGWTVELLDGSNQVIATQTTGTGGTYAFTGIGPGTYSIQEVLQAGYVQSSTPARFSETATSGQNVAGLDFGDFQTVNLAGEVYNDLNGDGRLENGEPGLTGWTVNLLDAASHVVATTTTDGSGDYAFADVGPGHFTIQEVLADRVRRLARRQHRRDDRERPERPRARPRRLPDGHRRRRAVQRPDRRRHARLGR